MFVPGRPASALRRLPFTLTMALTIVAVGVATGAATESVPQEVLQRWGFGLHDLWQGHPWAFFTSMPMNRGPLMFWFILVFVFASLGIYGWRRGTRFALRVYWVSEFAGACLQALLVALPMWAFDREVGLALVFSDDVGMSGGGFGCVGASVATLKSELRAWVFPGSGS